MNRSLHNLLYLYSINIKTPSQFSLRQRLSMNTPRGALIVFEGCDRSGKTTQCKNLVQTIHKKGLDVQLMSFPDRSTPTGIIIDKYLKNKQSLSNEVIHLLFAANRWEAKDEMERLLASGTSIIVDRYSYSGVAYSTAKGLDFEWCKTQEIGLLRPDLVVYLTLAPESINQRGGFGAERYENETIQRKVAAVFEKMTEEGLWMVVDADKPEQLLLQELEQIVTSKIKTVNSALLRMW